MKRRIAVNTLLSFILLPLFITARDYYIIVMLRDHSYFYGNFWDYFRAGIFNIFLFTPLFWLIFVMMPYNLILLRKLQKRPVRFYEKVLYFEAILLVIWCLLGTFINLWTYPYWKNLDVVLFCIPPSLIFSGLIHILVDRREINPTENRLQKGQPDAN